MWNAGLDESQAGIKTAGKNINNFEYSDNTTQMAESRVSKEPLDEDERGEWKKTGLKLNIQKNKTMASFPITSWQTDGVKWKQWQIFFFRAPKSLWTVATAMKLKDCSLEEKLWKT